MKTLFPEKLLNVITTRGLQDRLSELVERHGLSGWTVLEAAGAGAQGLQTGTFDADTNILFMVILPTAKLEPVLEDVEDLIRRGHHLTLFVSDVSVLRPDKFERALK
jgi:nitrogen regulatory protein PII